MRSKQINAARADTGSVAFWSYLFAQDRLQRPQESMTDLLTDLRHFAAAAGIDFEAAVRMSEFPYEEESD
jgi:hypothetical protein